MLRRFILYSLLAIVTISTSWGLYASDSFLNSVPRLLGFKPSAAQRQQDLKQRASLRFEEQQYITIQIRRLQSVTTPEQAEQSRKAQADAREIQIRKQMELE